MKAKDFGYGTIVTGALMEFFSLIGEQWPPHWVGLVMIVVSAFLYVQPTK